jgi:hypothetical protein
MKISDEIVKDFFNSLEADENIPIATINRLKELWDQKIICSQEEIRESITRGLTDERKN